MYGFIRLSHKSGYHLCAACPAVLLIGSILITICFDMTREKALCSRENRERTSEKLSCRVFGKDQSDYLAQLPVLFVHNSEIFYISFATFALQFHGASAMQ